MNPQRAFKLTHLQNRSTVYVNPDSIQAIEVFHDHTRIFIAGYRIDVRETPIRGSRSWSWVKNEPT